MWFVLVMPSGLEVALDFYDEVLVLAWSNLVSLRVWARWAAPWPAETAALFVGVLASAVCFFWSV